jgi:phospholipase/lecithinase/hemolysin
MHRRQSLALSTRLSPCGTGADAVEFIIMTRSRLGAIQSQCMRWSRCVFALWLATASVPQVIAHSWDALYVFGDSYSDSGAGYVYGNGPTAVVYLAKALNIPFTYVGDPNSSGKGLNFAVSSAKTGKSEGFRIRPGGSVCGFGESLFGRGMQTQVADLAERVRAGKLRVDSEKTLFFLAGGLNDASLPTRTSISNLEDELRSLYELGGRYFMVALVPTKLLPAAKSYKALNQAIASIPHHLRAELNGIHLVVSRWGPYYDEVFENPRKYGITNTKDRCAAPALFGEDPRPCATPDSYFFYYEGHPSTAVHRLVGLKIEKEVLAAFP